MFFKDINRGDVVKMRDDVPKINPIWENTIQVSVCFTSHSMKSIYIVLTVQGSAKTRKFILKITRRISHNLMDLSNSPTSTSIR